jgi:hypothetical protein
MKPTSVNEMPLLDLSMNRRNMLSRGGAVAAGIALPASVGGLGLLAAGSAHASTRTFTAMGGTTYTATIGGKTWKIIVYKDAVTSGQALVTMSNNSGQKSAVFYGTLATEWWNGFSSTLQNKKLVFTLTNSVGSQSHKNRTLAISISNTPFTYTPYQTVVSSIMTLVSGATVVCLYQKFTDVGSVGYKAKVVGTTTAGLPYTGNVATFMGANVQKWETYATAYKNACTNLTQAQWNAYGLTIGVALAAGLGVAGSVVTGGAALPILGGAIATLSVGGAALSQTIVSAQAAVAVAWADLSGFVEGAAGGDWVR